MGWRIMFCVLIVLTLSENMAGARKVGDHLRLIKQSDDDRNDLQTHNHHHMDLSLTIFFTIDNLKIGKTLPIYFSKQTSPASPRLLSREEANSVPFSLSHLSYLLQLFSLSKGSPQANAVEYTLTQCELESIKGETKFCATSLESMLDSAGTIFGKDTRFKVLTTSFLTERTAEFQNYTILEEPKEVVAKKVIGCHTMPYPYMVYYCHGQEGNRLFEVLLGGDNGERVEAAAMCHMDTSKWDHDSPSFRVLKIQPGTSPVCHFFPTDHLVWVPLPAA